MGRIEVGDAVDCDAAGYGRPDPVPDPEPGSKKPLAAVDVPVIVVVVELEPPGTVSEAACGGGASRRRSRPQTFAEEEVYSWIVHMVMSSLGSTLVIE